MVRLDWIENFTGNQYIDTGFKPNQDTRVVMRVSEPGNNAWFYSVWSTTQWNNNNYSMINDYDSSSGKIFVAYGDQTGGDKPVITGESEIDYNKNTLTINGEVIKTFSDTVFQATYNLYLFARNYVGNVRYGPATSSFRLHGCQIYDNGVLIRDFVPALDDEFALCLYDRVTKTYFYNKGSGTFKGAFPQSAKAWEIQQETLKAFADEARRLGNVEGELTTAQMQEIFAGVTASDYGGEIDLPDAESTTFGSEFSTDSVSTGKYLVGDYKISGLPSGQYSTHPYCLIQYSGGQLNLYYSTKPIQRSDTGNYDGAFYTDGKTGSATYYTAQVTWSSELKEYLVGEWEGPKSSGTWFNSNGGLTILWANHNLVHPETGAVMFTGGALVPEVEEGTIITEVDREALYQITGASLNAIATAIQRLTGNTDLLTPATMESSIINIIGTV